MAIPTNATNATKRTNKIRQLLYDECERRLKRSGCRGATQCLNPCATSTPLCAATGKTRKPAPPPDTNGCAEPWRTE